MASADQAVAGRGFLAEIHEQPEALRRVIGHGAVAQAATALRSLGSGRVRFVAHGSSDNAATYGVYAFGLLAGWAAHRDSISLSLYYGAGPDEDATPVIALSQSGETRDVVEYVSRARRSGALTIAVTNSADSPLAAAAQLVLPLLSGPERTVAATKTYMNELALLAQLAAHVGGGAEETEEHLRRTAHLMEETIPAFEGAVEPVSALLGHADRLFVIARGIELGTAREVALKLTETCGVLAAGLTATDFAHGPVGALIRPFPVLAVVSDRPGLEPVQDAVERAVAAGAPVVALGSRAGEVDGADRTLVTPAAPGTVCAPLLSVLPGQLLAAVHARRRGLDPDRPAELLSKVTVAP